jgi:hypothetical protein
MNIWLALVLIFVFFAIGYTLGKDEGIKATHIALTGESKPDSK